MYHENILECAKLTLVLQRTNKQFIWVIDFCPKNHGFYPLTYFTLLKNIKHSGRISGDEIKEKHTVNYKFIPTHRT